MKNASLSIAVFAFTMVLAIQSAQAQSIPDIQGSITQGSQIAEIIREQDRIGPRLGDDGNEIDGEAGIYVLRVNEIFYVAGSYGLGYSENPVRTVNNPGDSFSANLAASAGVQTRIAEALDFGVRATVSGTEYGEAFAPSSRSVNGAINVGTQIGQSPIYIGVTAFGGLNYDGRFENGTAFYGVSGSLSAGLPVGKRTVIRPGLGVTRQWSEIEENNSVSGAASLEVSHAVTQKISVGASARITRTWFDNFFEDVTFVKRKDWQYGGGVNATYRVNDKISVGAAAGYETRDSSFFVSEYDSFEASLTFSARIRF